MGSHMFRAFAIILIANEVVRIVLDSYLEPVNLDRTMSGATLGLGDALDGDSAYLDATELKNYQQAMHVGRAVGAANLPAEGKKELFTVVKRVGDA